MAVADNGDGMVLCVYIYVRVALLQLERSGVQAMESRSCNFVEGGVA
jgi:hypothetical protein